jgi:hypothetical protein
VVVLIYPHILIFCSNSCKGAARTRRWKGPSVLYT